MDKNTDIIAAYLTQVSALQERGEDPLSTQELQRIALELGISTAEIERAELAAQDHQHRAEQFLQRQLFDDAIVQLQAAVVLRPMDEQLIMQLADAHFHRWQHSKQTDDHEAASRLARQVLVVDANHHRAYDLLGALQLERRAPVGRRSWILAACIIGTVLLVLGGASRLLPPAPSSSAEPASAITSASPAVVTAQPARPNVTIVPAEDLPDATLSIAHAQHRVYQDSWSYTIKGRLTNNTAVQINTLNAVVTVRSSSGEILSRRNVDVQPKYRAPLRPGDVCGYSVLLLERTAFPEEARPLDVTLAVNGHTTQTAAASYPPDTPAQLQWPNGVPSAGISVGAALRSEQTSPSLSDSIYHRATYRLTVDEHSAAVSLLKLQLTHHDATGNPIGDGTAIYAVTTDQPPLEPGESRNVLFLTMLPEQPARTELTVIEAR